MEGTLAKANELAAKGRWSEVWTLIESLPTDDRMTPEVGAQRLACCTELKSWAIGKAVVPLLAADEEDSLLQNAAGRFHYELSIHEAGQGRMASSLSAFKQALAHAPALFFDAMRDDRMNPLLLHPYPAA